MGEWRQLLEKIARAPARMSLFGQSDNGLGERIVRIECHSVLLELLEGLPLGRTIQSGMSQGSYEEFMRRTAAFVCSLFHT